MAAKARTQASVVVQSGLQATISAQAVSSDGQFAATAEFRTGRVHVWDIRTGLQVRTLILPYNVTDIAFLPDGRLALAGETAEVGIASVASGVLTSELPTPLSQLRGRARLLYGRDIPRVLNEEAPVAASATGLIAGSDLDLQGGTQIPTDLGSTGVSVEGHGTILINIWDRSARWMFSLRNPGDGLGSELTALAFDSTGTLLVSVSRNGGVKGWDLARRALAWSTAVTDSETASLRESAIAVTSERIAVVTNGRLAILDRRSGAVVARPVVDSAWSVALVKDTLILGTAKGLLRMALSSMNVPTNLSTGPAQYVSAIPNAPLALVGAGTSLVITDLRTGFELRGLAPQVDLAEVTFAGREPGLITSTAEQTLRWSLDVSPAPHILPSIGGQVRAFGRSPDGMLLLASVRNNGDRDRLVMLDAVTGQDRWTVPGSFEHPQFSPEGRYVLGLQGRAIAVLLDVNDGHELRRIRLTGSLDAPRVAFGVAFLMFHDRLGIVSAGPAADSRQTRVDWWSLDDTSRAVVARGGQDGPTVNLVTSRDGRWIAWSFPEGDAVGTIDMKTRRLARVPRNGCSIALADSGGLLAIGSVDGRVSFWDLNSVRELSSEVAHSAWVDIVQFAPGAIPLALTGARDGLIRLWRTAGPAPAALVQLIVKGTERLIYTDSGYYSGGRSALEAVAFRVGERALPFEEFDLQFNRPDLVLRALGAPDSLQLTYAQARQRRLRRVGLSSAAQVTVPPGVRLDWASLPATTARSSVLLRATLYRAGPALARVHVEVNGIPVFGSAGATVDSLMLYNRLRVSGDSLHLSLPVRLTSGRNRLRVSVEDSAGTYSLGEMADVLSTSSAVAPVLHVVAVGVSAYRDTTRRLRFAEKDARDIAALFAHQKQRTGSAQMHVLVDSDATREHIMRLRKVLLGTQPEDVVVVFFAGHGLLDMDRQYWFGTYDIDFAHPEKRGMSYREIESLLDGIPARQKLLLLDTCHGGELETGAAAEASSVAAERLVDDLFGDFRRSTGATVLAAAGGAEVAVERRKWRNGVFTFAVREGLGDRLADTDHDGHVRLSELRNYVGQRVLELTRGLQRPVTRRENTTQDLLLR